MPGRGGCPSLPGTFARHSNEQIDAQRKRKRSFRSIYFFVRSLNQLFASFVYELGAPCHRRAPLRFFARRFFPHRVFFFLHAAQQLI